jgi:hypothetical protein
MKSDGFLFIGLLVISLVFSAAHPKRGWHKNYNRSVGECRGDGALWRKGSIPIKYEDSTSFAWNCLGLGLGLSVDLQLS